MKGVEEMNKFKIFLWIFSIYILQNVFCPIVTVTGVVPDLMLGFLTAYAALEERFNKLLPLILICAVIDATMTGRVFPITTAFVGLGGIASYIMRDYMRFIPKLVRTQAVTALSAFLMSCAEFFVVSNTITVEFLKNTAIWYTVYTVVASIIIYFILNRVMFKKTEKKLLIVQERN